MDESLVLVNMSPIKGFDPFKFVIPRHQEIMFREAGVYIEVLEDQSMLSVLALRQIENTTGHHITLKPFEKVTNMRVDKDAVAVVLRVVETKDVSHGFEIKRMGYRVYGFNKVDVGWIGQKTITVWDEDFEPQFVRTFGTGVNLAEWIDKIWYARECGRPGTSKNPLDTYDRTVSGGGLNKMKSHWMVETVPDQGRSVRMNHCQNIKLSSNSYISMVPRNPEDNYPRFTQSGLPKNMQVPTRDPKNCDHIAFICPTKKCVDSWGIDHQVFLERTIAGRRFKGLLDQESDG